MVVEADRVTDIVQNRRGGEDLALPRAEAMQSGELVEQLQRQFAHVMRVVVPRAVLPGRVLDAERAHVVDDRHARVRQELCEEQPFAHPCAADGKLLKPAKPHQLMHDDRAGQNHVDAVGVHPRHREQFACAHLAHLREQVLDRAEAQLVAVQPLQRVTLAGLVEFGQRTRRPAHADERPQILRGHSPHIRQPWQPVQFAGDVVAQRKYLPA